MPEVPATGSPRLDYAEGPGRPRTRRLIRIAVIALSVALLASAAWRTAPEFLARIRLIRLQQRCAAHRGPADQVASIEPLPIRWETAYAYARADPTYLTDLLAQLVPDAHSTSRDDGPAVFLHERTTSGGERRVVLLRRVPPTNRQSIDIPISFDATVIAPGTFGSPPQTRRFRLPDPIGTSYPDDPKATPALRVFAGQPDPNDAARFTIGYEAGGNVGELVGRLVEGESGELTVELQRGD